MEQKHIKVREKELILLSEFFRKSRKLSNICYNISQNIINTENIIDGNIFNQIKESVVEFDEIMSKLAKYRKRINRFIST